MCLLQHGMGEKVGVVSSLRSAVRNAEVVEIRGPQIQEQVAEAFKVIPQERVSERVVVPQILEQSVEVMTVAGAGCRNA